MTANQIEFGSSKEREQIHNNRILEEEKKNNVALYIKPESSNKLVYNKNEDAAPPNRTIEFRIFIPCAIKSNEMFDVKLKLPHHKYLYPNT